MNSRPPIMHKGRPIPRRIKGTIVAPSLSSIKTSPVFLTNEVASIGDTIERLFGKASSEAIEKRAKMMKEAMEFIEGKENENALDQIDKFTKNHKKDDEIFVMLSDVHAGADSAKLHHLMGKGFEPGKIVVMDSLLNIPSGKYRNLLPRIPIEDYPIRNPHIATGKVLLADGIAHRAINRVMVASAGMGCSHYPNHSEGHINGLIQKSVELWAEAELRKEPVNPIKRMKFLKKEMNQAMKRNNTKLYAELKDEYDSIKRGRK